MLLFIEKGVINMNFEDFGNWGSGEFGGDVFVLGVSFL